MRIIALAALVFLCSACENEYKRQQRINDFCYHAVWRRVTRGEYGYDLIVGTDPRFRAWFDAEYAQCLRQEQ